MKRRSLLRWAPVFASLVGLVPGACDASDPSAGDPAVWTAAVSDDDLDGLVGAADSDPEDPFNRAFSRAGSLAHQEIGRSVFESTTSTWDGLLHFSLRPTWPTTTNSRCPGEAKAAWHCFRLVNHGLVPGEEVWLRDVDPGDTELPALPTEHAWYAYPSDADSFQLAATPGGPHVGIPRLVEDAPVAKFLIGPPPPSEAEDTYYVIPLHARKLFSPGNDCAGATLGRCGLPDFTAPGVWGAPRKLGRTLGASKHITVYKDPAAGLFNPYRSTCQEMASPLHDANGPCDTYRLGVIASATVPGVDEFALTLRFATVVVRRDVAEVAYAGFNDQEGEAPHYLQHAGTSGGGKLWGIEPSVTNDGHLLVWHGMIDNEPLGRLPFPGPVLYSVNTGLGDPWTAWSKPRSITQMYAAHGGGAHVFIDHVPFAEKYPIAQRPLLAADGQPLREFHPGPYPWISFDGSELFFAAAIISPGAQARSGVSVIGQRTNWRLQHLDGVINPSRTTLVEDGRGFLHDNDDEDEVQERTLTQAYNANTLGADSLSQQVFGVQPLGNANMERVVQGQLALAASMWSPLGDAVSPLPRDPRPGVYAFQASLSKRYVEVPLTQVEDGNYVLYLPMNERLAFDTAAIDAWIASSRAYAQLPPEPDPGSPGRSELIAQAAQANFAQAHLTRDTPDIVAGQHGTLVGEARFPFEEHTAAHAWHDYWQSLLDAPNGPAVPATVANPNPVAGDRIEGAVGNAIYFHPSGAVTVELAASSVADLEAAGAISIELWFRRVQSGGNSDAVRLFQGVGARIALDADGVQATLGPLTCAAPLAHDFGWHHVALTWGPSAQLHVFLDGDRQACHPEGDLPPIASRTVIVGPDGDADPDTLVLIDEVAISKAKRSRDEIRMSALRYRAPLPATIPDAYLHGPRTSALVPDPSLRGLEAARVAIPYWPSARTNALATLAELGRQLFVDPRLSRDGSVSCASCHSPQWAFSDRRCLVNGDDCRFSLGVDDQIGTRNASTLGNRVLGAGQFWDSRADSLEAQVEGPLTHPKEMGNPSVDAVAERLEPDYASAFAAAFGPSGAAEVTPERLGQALATYERTLLSSDSRYDRGLLTPNEQRGEALFFGRARCSSCHRGPNFSDERLRNPGLPAGDEDTGLAGVTHRASDAHKFRTPSLRDVQKTAPYYHDGRFATLGEVIRFYDKGGLDTNGRDPAIRRLGLSPTDIANLVAFLDTLNGSTMRYNANGRRQPPRPEVVEVSALKSASKVVTVVQLLGWHLDDYGPPTVELSNSETFESSVSPFSVPTFDAAWTSRTYRGSWQRFRVVLPLGELALYARVRSGTETSAVVRIR